MYKEISALASGDNDCQLQSAEPDTYDLKLQFNTTIQIFIFMLYLPTSAKLSSLCDERFFLANAHVVFKHVITHGSQLSRMRLFLGYSRTVFSQATLD